jgi:EAL domain-containing protein (putative c-di-GMP-specific phosphodiesterase class I)
MTDAESAVETLRQIKARGIRLALDDFGTGYSSLSYLKRFPLDALKIDRAFIRDVTENPDDVSIVVAIINLARSLKLQVIAEGVETQEQLAFLRRHGCDEAQGYYIARPMDVAAISRLLGADAGGRSGDPVRVRAAMMDFAAG